jgi:hypothetical protein
LQSHRINSLAELRQIEIVFASIGTPDVQAPMTLACESLWVLARLTM